ncbi:MarR family winged helix-turn-helix transcriptional regulator [Microbacterium sp. P06]|uniref:MarR family winged helix-turn-helix transcriptional regulator n=1 Tax=unclassified Microbacterium TaxID=2609290 RepID=UPI0037468C14
MTTQPGRSHRLDAFPAAAVRFSRALDRNRERIAEEEGLSASELRALFFIGEHVSVTPKQLAAHMHLTTTAITFISRRLVEIGMLHRVDHPDDRRKIFLELTDDAHATVERIHLEFDEMVRNATSHLTDAQVDDFTGYLQSVGTAVAEHTARLSNGKSAATI